LNEGLSWKTHMFAISKKVRINAAITYKLRYYLNKVNLVKVYHALITSHLHYCITVWNHGNETIANKIQSLCNNLMKHITKTYNTGKIQVLSI